MKVGLNAVSRNLKFAIFSLGLGALFYNLVNNALKFTQPDIPPLITVSAVPAAEPEGSSAPMPGFMQIMVQDNGIGFRMEEAPRPTSVLNFL